MKGLGEGENRDFWPDIFDLFYSVLRRLILFVEMSIECGLFNVEFSNACVSGFASFL